MVRVHSGLPFQVAAPFSICDSLPVFLTSSLHQPGLTQLRHRSLRIVLRVRVRLRDYLLLIPEKY
jgi:hypothetical protein